MIDRRGFLGTAAAAASTGCLHARGGDRPEEGGERGGVPTAEALYSGHSLDELDSAAVGVTGQDSIPSIEQPVYAEAGSETAEQENDDGDLVFGFTHDGEAYAFPHSVLVWHEIVNDSFGGEPLSITYCPLTATAMGFRRGDTEFGVSGNLVNSNLIMYDRETGSWWPQMMATAVNGAHRGDGLQEFRLKFTSWGQWKDLHPDTHVLTEDTGYGRNYSRDPYGEYNPTSGYYVDDSLLFEPMVEDDRLPLKERVIGHRGSERAVAFRLSSVEEEGALSQEVEDVEYTAVYDEAVGTADVLRDGEEVYAYHSFWFPWVGYYPDTTLVE